MNKYRIQIQQCIYYDIKAESVENARMEIIDSLSEILVENNYSECCVSEGELLEGKNEFE